MKYAPLRIRLVALAIGLTVWRFPGDGAKADPRNLSVCNRSPLCGLRLTDFEQAADFPRGAFLEPDGQNLAPVTDGSQKLNDKAISFSGSNFLWSPGSRTLGSTFTVAVWVYPTVLGATNQKQMILSEDGDNAYGNSLYLQNQAGNLKAVIEVRDGIDPKSGTVVTATAPSSGGLSLSAWHLVVARCRPKWDYNSATNDGKLEVSVDNATFVSTAVTKPLNTGGGRLFLGKQNKNGAENYYTGRMDQLAVGGVFITDEQAAFLWNGGAGLQYPFVNANPSYSTPTSHWRFDRIYKTRIADDASGFNDAFVAGGTAVQGIGGPFGSSIDLTAGYLSVSSTSFEPLSLSPTLWLKADTIGGLNDGDAVTNWSDQSGNGYVFTQATGGLKPLYKAGVLNGLPAVRFDGVDDRMKGTGGNPTLSQLIGAQAGTIFMVGRRTNHTLPTAFFGNGATTANVQLSASGNPTSAVAAANFDGTNDSASKTTDASYHVFMWRHDATNVSVAVDDARDTGLVNTVSGATASLTSALTLGYTNDTTPASWHDGDITDLIAFNTALSQTDRQNVEQYLANKYAIPLPYTYIANPNQNLQTHGRAFTVEGWFKVSSTTVSQGIVANWDRSGSDNNGWRVFANSDGVNSKLRFEWGNGSSTAYTEDTTFGNLTAGTWYYFAARWSGSTFRVQVNASLNAASSSALVPSTVSYFYFGTKDDGTSNKLTGSLSSVSWHKGLYLSDGEIAAHYNTGSGRACCPIK